MLPLHRRLYGRAAAAAAYNVARWWERVHSDFARSRSLNVGGVLPSSFSKTDPACMPASLSVCVCVCVYPPHFFLTSKHFLFSVLFFLFFSTSINTHTHRNAPTHTLSSLPFAVIDGVEQQSTEQRAASSPKQDCVWEGRSAGVA